MSIFTKHALLAVVVMIFAVLVVFPLYILCKISLSEPTEIFAERPPYLIRNITTEHFKDVLCSGRSFFDPLAKSAATALFASICALILSVPAAYAISKFDYRLRYTALLMIFLTRMIPEISIALPVSIRFLSLGLYDSVAGLTLAHTIRIAPVTCFILVGVFSSFPEELEKQARIDGYSRLGALRVIILPLSAGGVAVAGIFSFLLSWDEFIYAAYLSLARPTMPLKMYYYVSRGDLFYSATYAVLITIPVLILALFVQKFIKPGYLSGAIKG